MNNNSPHSSNTYRSALSVLRHFTKSKLRLSALVVLGLAATRCLRLWPSCRERMQRRLRAQRYKKGARGSTSPIRGPVDEAITVGSLRPAMEKPLSEPLSKRFGACWRPRRFLMLTAAVFAVVLSLLHNHSGSDQRRQPRRYDQRVWRHVCRADQHQQSVNPAGPQREHQSEYRSASG